MSAALAEQLGKLPDYLAGHMMLTLLALGLALVICLPLGIAATRYKYLQGPILGIASVLQTVPGIALLALMVPLLGQIGFLPALVALFVYSTLPILRNTVTGIIGVDPALTEAADGIGMTSWQKLTKVELPLAASVIIAGIRTSTVWVVGTATLSTPVGATSLGNYIFSGLQTQNQTAVLLGCVAAALLAIVLDQIIRLYERSAADRRRLPAYIATVLLLLIVGGSVTPKIMAGIENDDRPKLVVGAKTFTEQYILANLISMRLDSAGFDATARTSMGSTILFEALANGNIDCYVDYSGTIWANVMEREDIPSRDSVLTGMTDWLMAERGVLCLGPLGFENTYALAMENHDAEELGIRSIRDLTPHDDDMILGGDYEFFERPEWDALRNTYDLDFGTLRKMDAALMYSAIVEDQLDVITAYSTDGRIVDYDLRVLSDPGRAFPPYDAVLLLSPTAAQNDAMIEALRPLIGAISDEAMRRANKHVDLDEWPVTEAAAALLEEIMMSDVIDQ